MTEPARDRWWDDVVGVDWVKLNDWTDLLGGDRVTVLERDRDTGYWTSPVELLHAIGTWRGCSTTCGRVTVSHQ